MDEQLRFGIAGGFFLATAAICYIKMLFLSSAGDPRFVAKAKAKGNVTSGNYVSGKYSQRTDHRGERYFDTRYTVKYQYQVGGKSYYKKLKYYAEHGCGVEYPHQITIYYDANHPKRAKAESEVTPSARGAKGCIVSIVAPLVVMKVVDLLLGLL